MNFYLPKEVLFILDTLSRNNYEGFIVGGCVRDGLLNKKPKDWDITTNALPDDIISMFEHTIPTGIKHGTVTVIIDKEPYEVTTYRIDGKYSDNRHPDKVSFTSSLREDLSRRDFTINAMAYNPEYGLQDPFSGRSALNSKLIACVGNPNERFSEDALRMLRAVRFSCQLDFSIEESTLKSISENSTLINNVSLERVRDELHKILLSPNPSIGIRALHYSGLLKYILPELEQCVGFEQRNIHHDKDVFDHTMLVLESTSSNIIVRLAALLHDVAKPQCFSIDDYGNGHLYKHHLKSADMSEIILKRLRFDNDTVKRVCTLITEHMSCHNNLKPTSIKKLINRVGTTDLQLLFDLQIADVLGHKPPHNLELVHHIRTEANKIINENQPLSLKDLKINGNDLIALGVHPGKAMGNILNELLEEILINPELNTKEALISIVKKQLTGSH